MSLENTKQIIASTYERTTKTIKDLLLHEVALLDKTGLDHILVAVRDLDEAEKIFNRFGLFEYIGPIVNYAFQEKIKAKERGEHVDVECVTLPIEGLYIERKKWGESIGMYDEGDIIFLLEDGLYEFDRAISTILFNERQGKLWPITNLREGPYVKNHTNFPKYSSREENEILYHKYWERILERIKQRREDPMSFRETYIGYSDSDAYELSTLEKQERIYLESLTMQLKEKNKFNLI